ncbi:MAG: hypothetical protein WAU11_03410 [Ignavibacteriaceae bacterium]
MKNNKLIWFVLTLIVLCAAFIVFVTNTVFVCNEQVEENFSNYSEAFNKGAFERNIVPEFIPKSVFEIKTLHDVDNNSLWIRFRNNLNDSSFIQNNFLEINKEQLRYFEINHPECVNWWFEDIIEQSPSNDNALYATYFQDKSNKYFLAKEKRSNKYFLWSK